MKNCLPYAIAICFLPLLAAAQPTGTLEVFGQRVVLPEEAFTEVVLLSASGEHGLALRADGAVIGWGRNEIGECDIPAFDAPVVFLEAGFGRSAALTASGAFVSWGGNPFGAGDAPDSNVGFVDVASGNLHNLLLRDDGVIVSQGLSYLGGELVPEPNSGWVDIAAFDEQSVGLKDDGTIWLWGSTTDTIPAHDPEFLRVEAGPGQAFALDAAGTVHHFGADYHGSSQLPQPNLGFTDLACGDGHVLALRGDGTVAAWGWNHHGQADPPPGGSYTDVEAGYFFSMARRSDGTVARWGNNGNAEMGLQPPADDLVAVAMGRNLGIALRSGGSIASWGSIPEPPAPNAGFTAITCGYEFAAGLRTDGSIADWGTWGGFSFPGFAPNEDFVDLDGGRQILLGRRSDGSLAVKARGGVLHDIPAPNSGYTRISVGFGFCLALRGLDGSIEAWGDPAGGVLEVPEPNSGFVDVFAGHGYAFGLRADDTVVMWGTSSAVPPELNHDIVDLAAVSAPYWTSLHADGSIALWFGGDVPEPNAGIIAMDAGAYGVAILRGNPTSAAAGGDVLPAWVPLVLDAHPNPFNPQTSVTVQALRGGKASLEVVDLRGRRVRLLWQGALAAGEVHRAVWDGADRAGRALPSGTYFLRATGPAGNTVVRKVALVR